MGKTVNLLASVSLLLIGASADAAAQGAADVCLPDTECMMSERDHSLLQVGAPSMSAADLDELSLAEGPIEWSSSGATVGDGHWCQTSAPSDGWSLKHCSADSDAGHEIKVLTYNLYWWNLFGWQFRNGNGGSAGKLIASTGQGKPYDFMGFQECEDVDRVLQDASLTGQYGSIEAEHAIAIAYRKVAWELLDHGMREVAEDKPEQWWGKRGAQWARFRHKSTGYALMFVNHHGALPVGSGGKCGLLGTAYNILHAITSHRQSGEGVVLVGDFNSNEGTEEIKELDRRLRRINTGTSFGGVDHIFTNCGGVHVVETRNLGNGGSDHDALDAVVRL
mmetsp:Transcript_146593/g.381038  ORF Transcript_146593/g.381038 Transcript_146593/m.381038 type:complete len:335 (+) Transcript_146593:70-1074(+)